MPTGICSMTDDAGDVDSEYKGLGASGVVGGLRYAFVGFMGIDGGGGWSLVGTLCEGQMRGLDWYLCWG
jgi:hypothetical protein